MNDTEGFYMKIVQTCMRYPPARGGVEEAVKNISEGLLTRGHKVEVLTSDLAQHVIPIKLNEHRRVINGVKIQRLFSIHPRIIPYSILPILPFKLLKAEVDIIHSHGFWYFPADISKIISRIKRVPFVLNPYFSPIYYRAQEVYKKILGRFIMNADVTVVVSDFEKTLIEEAGFKVSRFELIPSGVNLREFDIVTDNIYEKWNVDRREIVLFVGRIEPSKGVDILIEAAQYVVKKEPDVILFIVGPDFGIKNNLEEKVKKAKLNKNFIFAGELSRKDLISAFKNASIFVLPSRYETFGIVLIEAMTAGIPVIASDIAAIPYILKQNETGLLFELEKPKMLATYIITLLRDKDLRKYLIENGRKEVKSKYSWDKILPHYEEIYQSLIKG